MIYFLYVTKNFFETDYFSPVRFQKPFCEKERERDRRKNATASLLAVLYDFVRWTNIDAYIYVHSYIDRLVCESTYVYIKVYLYMYYA